MCFVDYLKLVFKGKLVLIYFYDDDVVLYVYDKLEWCYGSGFLCVLVVQKLNFLCGMVVLVVLVGIDFIGLLGNLIGYVIDSDMLVGYFILIDELFIVWNQCVVIFKVVCYLVMVKLLLFYLGLVEFQFSYGGWCVCVDVGEVFGLLLLELLKNVDVYDFICWMVDC